MSQREKSGNVRLRQRQRAVIVICTYKRIKLLSSLIEMIATQIAQLPSEYVVRIAVIDNDPEGSAVEHLTALKSRLHASGTVLDVHHEPNRGVGHARNRAFSVVTDDEWLIFFDDDQIPAPAWLRSLLDASGSYTGDIYVGPVRPTLPPSYPKWAEGAWAWSRPEFADGELRDHAGFGNIMLSPSALSDPSCRVSPPFVDGPGEDTSVTSALSKRGFRIVHVRSAGACEPVTEDRLTVAWVLARNRSAGRAWAKLTLNNRKGTVRLAFSFCRLLCDGTILGVRAVVRGSSRDAICAKARLATAAGYVSATYECLRGLGPRKVFAHSRLTRRPFDL